MFVKICVITTEDDALLAVALGADAVGFVFAPSPRQMAARRVYDITRRLPPETLTVGVFRDEAPQRVIEIVRAAGVKGAQLHGREPPSDTLEVHGQVRFVIKAFAAGSDDLRDAAEHGADALLIDSPNPGSGMVFDWGLVDAVAPSDRLDAEVERLTTAILAGGPRAIRLQKQLILEWEDMSATSAIAHGIDSFAEAYRTDEPHRMAMARLAEMRARRSLRDGPR